MQNQSKNPEFKVTKSEKRDAAKTAITLSIGTLAATGLMKGRGAKVLHLWSGIALMGFTYWHYTLYQPTTNPKQLGR